MTEESPSVERRDLFTRLKEEQRAWLAANTAAQFDERGYTTTVDVNLRTSLSESARRELAAGDGNELGHRELPGKLAAPWSSSALAINVFDYWRGRDLRALATALGVERTFTSVRLEAQLATGFSSRRANLDALLDGDRPMAIEAKFTEPFQDGPHGAIKNTISPTYLQLRNAKKWLGLEHLRSLALAIGERRFTFRRLDVPQLIKHTLALRLAGRGAELRLLWFDPGEGTREAAEMQHELVLLHEAMDADKVSFTVQTYQALVHGLRTHAADDPDAADYLVYLERRYFNGGAR